MTCPCSLGLEVCNCVVDSPIEPEDFPMRPKDGLLALALVLLPWVFVLILAHALGRVTGWW